jgi:hypothetical protein
MFTAYIVVTVLAANIFSATLDFTRYKQILINMAQGGRAGIVDNHAWHPSKERGRSDCWSASACR